MSRITPPHTALTRKKVLKAAIPILIVHMTIPLTGLIDTILIGRYYGEVQLAAMGLGTLVFSFVYWSFGFLRMSTTALTAQAMAKSSHTAILEPLLRNGLLALLLGVLLIVSQNLILFSALSLSDATGNVKNFASAYFKARIWGAPAELGLYVISGWLIGQTKTYFVLFLQCLINFLNIFLSILFVSLFKNGVIGVGSASALAYGIGLLCTFGFFQYQRGLNFFSFTGKNLPGWRTLFASKALKQLFSVNLGIMIRTLTLLCAFAYFINESAKSGTQTFAANQILLQYISISAYILDSFAFLAESYTGQAYGRKNRKEFLRAVRLTSEFSCFGALFSSALIWFLGGAGIEGITGIHTEVANTAKQVLPLVSLIPLLGVWAYQLDGIFIGAAQAKTLALAGILSLGLYLAIHTLFAAGQGNQSLWLAFLCYYFFRAFSLIIAWPHMMRHFTSRSVKS